MCKHPVSHDLVVAPEHHLHAQQVLIPLRAPVRITDRERYVMTSHDRWHVLPPVLRRPVRAPGRMGSWRGQHPASDASVTRCRIDEQAGRPQEGHRIERVEFVLAVPAVARPGICQRAFVLGGRAVYRLNLARSPGIDETAVPTVARSTVAWPAMLTPVSLAGKYADWPRDNSSERPEWSRSWAAPAMHSRIWGLPSGRPIGWSLRSRRLRRKSSTGVG